MMSSIFHGDHDRVDPTCPHYTHFIFHASYRSSFKPFHIFIMPAGPGKEDYMLVASGPSQYAPFLTTWKDFKDSLRRIIKDQPGWTEVKSGRRRGDMEAWCRFDGTEDVEAAYSIQSPLNAT
jgi:hypothetical protein